MISAINSTLQSGFPTKIKKTHPVLFKAVSPQQIDTANRKNQSNVNFKAGGKFILTTSVIGALGLGGAYIASSYGAAGAAVNWAALIGGISTVLAFGGGIYKIYLNT